MENPQGKASLRITSPGMGPFRCLSLHFPITFPSDFLWPFSFLKMFRSTFSFTTGFSWVPHLWALVGAISCSPELHPSADKHTEWQRQPPTPLSSLRSRNHCLSMQKWLRSWEIPGVSFLFGVFDLYWFVWITGSQNCFFASLTFQCVFLQVSAFLLSFRLLLLLSNTSTSFLGGKFPAKRLL